SLKRDAGCSERKGESGRKFSVEQRVYFVQHRPGSLDKLVAHRLALIPARLEDLLANHLRGERQSDRIGQPCIRMDGGGKQVVKQDEYATQTDLGLRQLPACDAHETAPDGLAHEAGAFAQCRGRCRERIRLSRDATAVLQGVKASQMRQHRLAHHHRFVREQVIEPVVPTENLFSHLTGAQPVLIAHDDGHVDVRDARGPNFSKLVNRRGSGVTRAKQLEVPPQAGFVIGHAERTHVGHDSTRLFGVLRRHGVDGLARDSDSLAKWRIASTMRAFGPRGWGAPTHGAQRLNTASAWPRRAQDQAAIRRSRSTRALFTSGSNSERTRVAHSKAGSASGEYSAAARQMASDFEHRSPWLCKTYAGSSAISPASPLRRNAFMPPSFSINPSRRRSVR